MTPMSSSGVDLARRTRELATLGLGMSARKRPRANARASNDATHGDGANEEGARKQRTVTRARRGAAARRRVRAPNECGSCVDHPFSCQSAIDACKRGHANCFERHANGCLKSESMMNKEREVTYWARAALDGSCTEIYGMMLDCGWKPGKWEVFELMRRAARSSCVAAMARTVESSFFDYYYALEFKLFPSEVASIALVSAKAKDIAGLKFVLDDLVGVLYSELYQPRELSAKVPTMEEFKQQICDETRSGAYDLETWNMLCFGLSQSNQHIAATKAFVGVCNRGNTELLKHFCEKLLVNPSKALTSRIRNQELRSFSADVFKYLRTHGMKIKFRKYDMDYAVESNEVEFVRFLHEDHRLCFDHYHFTIAVGSGATELLRYMYDSASESAKAKFTFDHEDLEAAAANGFHELVKYMHEEHHVPLCSCSLGCALESRSYETCRYLIEHRVHVDLAAIHYDLMAEFGHTLLNIGSNGPCVSHLNWQIGGVTEIKEVRAFYQYVKNKLQEETNKELARVRKLLECVERCSERNEINNAEYIELCAMLKKLHESFTTGASQWRIAGE